MVNKVAHYVMSNYEYVVFQADDVCSWQKLFGRRIYEAPQGELRDALKMKANTPIVKTTTVCPKCGARVRLKLSDREFVCPSRGSWFDRDVASALVIKREGLCPGTRARRPGIITPLRVACWITSPVFHVWKQARP